LNPYTRYLEIEGAWLHKVDIYFPPGCCNMVGVRLYYGIYQLLPRPYGAWLTGDNVNISVPINLRLPDLPTRLKLVAHSEGTGYSHTLTLRFYVLEKYTEHPYIAMSDLVERLDVLLKRIGAW